MSDNIYSSSVKNKLKLKDNGKSYLKLSKEEEQLKKIKKKAKKEKKLAKKIEKQAKSIAKTQKLNYEELLKSQQPVDLQAGLTSSQKKLLKHTEEKQKKEYRKLAQESHQDRLDKMNDKLAAQSDCLDIQKVSWTK